MNKNTLYSIILIIVITGIVFFLLTSNKPIIEKKVISPDQELSIQNNFPPSQKSMDGFFIGQHISAVINVLGESDQISSEKDGVSSYAYWLDESHSTFLAFSIFRPESGIIGAIQITGEKSDKINFLGLKLGDLKEKVVRVLGKPSSVELGTRNSDLYLYNNRNYSVELDKEGKLFSIRILGLDGFEENVEIGDFIENFKGALNKSDINKISELLMPDVEICTKEDIFKVTKRFLDELSDPNSKIMKYLLFNKNNIRNILNEYKGKIDMQMRITEKGPSGYVYKFPDSKVLEEIFVIEYAGNYRAWEIKYR